MYISLDRTVGAYPVGPKGDMRWRGVLSVVVKTPEMHIPPWYWFRYHCLALERLGNIPKVIQKGDCHV